MQTLPQRKHATLSPLLGSAALRAAAALLACALGSALPARAQGPAPAAAAPTSPAAPEAQAPIPTPATPPPAPPVSDRAERPPLPTAQSLGLSETRLDVHTFRVVESYSGSISYYRVVEDPIEPFIRAIYRPPLETVTLGIEIPDQHRHGVKKIRWRWRAMVLPKNGDECKGGQGDSSAVIYVSWKRGLKWYSLKYVWSAVGKKGQVCDQKRNLFVVQDTIIRETGGPVGVWMNEEIDPSAEFRAHFENGDPNAEVPAFAGIGIMSDGDQTKSVSAADYTGFSLLY